MYDERIHSEINRYGIKKSIEIEPVRLRDVIENFKSEKPQNVILTGTAGDGKTYQCRRVWEYFNGNPERWNLGEKIVGIKLPTSPVSLAYCTRE